MTVLDWSVVGIYSVLSLTLGVVLTRKASQGMESYFASDRNLSWWLAGTSMAATAFSSDTPLLITGIVRRRGIWGNWEVWALSLSTMLAVFFFSKLWKRSKVLTEVEFVELRYSGRPAAWLRGVKALYWGVFYNVFVMGAWPMTGLTKIMQETTDWSKAQAIFFCMGLTAIYSALSGYWGVILTDFFQFIIAMTGAIILAVYAVNACGGMPVIIDKLSGTDKLLFLPPLGNPENLGQALASPFGWFLGLICLQWWAWKNADGGGIIVQRIASCKNEKHAIYATLWFNIAQYALRSWPWILTALASLVLLPDLTDHERAYPRLVAQLLPSGLKGLMIASFFAAFMSTMSTHLNWGASYFVNDFYKRFVRPEAPEKHYVRAAQLCSCVLAAAATIVAFFTDSIGEVFTFILNLTAAIGPVYFLRWFWWRINAWSEITAMTVSLPVILSRSWFFAACGIQQNLLFDLLYMILASACFWLPLTLLTPPVTAEKLTAFFKTIQPPGFWQNPVHFAKEWAADLKLWALATVALLALSIGPLKLFLLQWLEGGLWTAAAIVLWIYVFYQLHQTHQDKKN